MQDGDEDSSERTEVSAYKATKSRGEVQKISEGTPTQKYHQRERERSHKQHEARHQKRKRRRTKSQESLR